jgi:hypothetical protein
MRRSRTHLKEPPNRQPVATPGTHFPWFPRFMFSWTQACPSPPLAFCLGVIYKNRWGSHSPPAPVNPRPPPLDTRRWHPITTHHRKPSSSISSRSPAYMYARQAAHSVNTCLLTLLGKPLHTTPYLAAESCTYIIKHHVDQLRRASRVDHQHKSYRSANSQ